ncbi:MAG: type II toxin-antitoxin system VapC family toxin [Chloroflexaceae bacterium]|nr:type II toxin-antitoxin system VapC family toxin [Chloroflexaceae bacterium]
MAGLTDLAGQRVGLDTVIFIYALEGNPKLGRAALEVFSQLEGGLFRGYACDLVLAELIVQPLRLGRDEIVTEYLQELPRFPHLNFCHLTQAVVIEAGRLRGRYSVGLADALHLEATRSAGCTVFLTNDQALSQVESGLRILQLQELSLP